MRRSCWSWARCPPAVFPLSIWGALADEDLRRDADSGLPRRFAVARGIDVSTQAGGLWAQADSGDWVWQYKVRGSGAVHLNFGFDQVRLPEGARLDIFGAKGATALGPYTAADIPPHGQLWTAVLDGEDATIQLRVPATGRNQAHLRLMRVGQGYRGFGHFSKVCKSGSCNTDVACLASNDPWNRPRRSVGAYTVGGTDTCTGSLLNNTANDRRNALRHGNPLRRWQQQCGAKLWWSTGTTNRRPAACRVRRRAVHRSRVPPPPRKAWPSWRPRTAPGAAAPPVRARTSP
ncbi:MAG: hypothetical protein AB7S42_05675 [Lysobacteraceae bacterium]|nr:hypothetical protein [Xanthomonadaceae bacterium]